MLTTPRLIAIALCAALNFAVGSIVHLTHLPLYLDSIGTILCALLIFPDRRAAFVCSFLAAMISTVITTLFINPFLIWFSATELALALVAAYFIADAEAIFRARPLPVLRFGLRVVLYGILTGVVSAVVSAPLVAHVFGGGTRSGAALLVAFFLKAGQPLMAAVRRSGFSRE